jgi:large subunit ribosomal protein L10
MNREQKGAVIAEIAADIEAAQAIFAVDYRGISVPQAAELRGKLREADATFKVVKNSLTERAADQVGRGELKTLLVGPTALTFVRGDAATAAKAIADYARATQLLPFKGGTMGTESLGAEQIVAISRLPSREVLYGQLVGVVASPVSGLVRTLGALVGGLAVALGQVREKKESGEIPAGEPPAALAVVDSGPESTADAPESVEAQAPAVEDAAAESVPEVPEEPVAQESAEQADADQAEPAADEPAAGDENQADASAQADTAEATKEN